MMRCPEDGAPKGAPYRAKRIAEEIADLDRERNVIRRYIPGSGIDERVAQLDAAGNVVFIHNDKQNSVIAISNILGAVVQKRAYGTYGETEPTQMTTTGTTGTTPHPFGYTGRRWDPDLGLYYYRARWYDPQLGTFLQTDPIGSLDYINLYSYVGLEPGNATDPSGLDAKVTVYSHEVIGGRGHSFFVIQDTVTGEKTIARAGASPGSVTAGSSQVFSNASTRSDTLGSGKIDAWIGRFDQAAEVIEIGAENFNVVREVGTFKESGAAMNGRFVDFNSRFDAQQNEYQLWDSNSNTYVGEALKNIFGQAPQDGGAFPLDGAKTDLPNVEVPYKPPEPKNRQ
jgi:RHS repeat-associated protein